MELEKVYKGRNIGEVVELLARHKEDGKIIAGGTDIIIELRNDKIASKVLIDIFSIEELHSIKDEGDFMEIGASVTYTEIDESP